MSQKNETSLELSEFLDDMEPKYITEDSRESLLRRFVEAQSQDYVLWEIMQDPRIFHFQVHMNRLNRIINNPVSEDFASEIEDYIKQYKDSLL